MLNNMKQFIKTYFPFLINFFKKIMIFFGVKLTNDFKIVSLYKYNVFNTRYHKRVLISYIVDPFVSKNNFSHTNLLECYTAAEIFNKLGYCVDVVDLNYIKRINYSKYDVVYGMGIPLENSFYYKGKKIKRIFYATGCNTLYSNIVTLLKVRNFFDSHDRLIINSSRFIEKNQHFQTLLSDRVIVLGNKFVLDTYKMFDLDGSKRYLNLNAFYYDVYDIDIYKKDFLTAGKHFLWFGSSGLIHKGLDLLIDIFSLREDIYLHICGDFGSEKEFYDYYGQIIDKSYNIINHGFVDIRSDEFKKIMNTCAFTIFPSVSEGGSPAVLNVIANGGLIPIITKSSGLDIDDFGIFIEKPEIIYVNDSIKKALSFNLDQLTKMSLFAKNYIRNNYTIEKYKENLIKIIKESI